MNPFDTSAPNPLVPMLTAKEQKDELTLLRQELKRQREVNELQTEEILTLGPRLVEALKRIAELEEVVRSHSLNKATLKVDASGFINIPPHLRPLPNTPPLPCTFKYRPYNNKSFGERINSGIGVDLLPDAERASIIRDIMSGKGVSAAFKRNDDGSYSTPSGYVFHLS